LLHYIIEKIYKKASIAYEELYNAGPDASNVEALETLFHGVME